MNSRRKRSLVWAAIASAALLLVYLIFHTRRIGFGGTASEGGNFGFDAELHLSPLTPPPQGSPSLAGAVAPRTLISEDIEPTATRAPIRESVTTAESNKHRVQGPTRLGEAGAVIGVVDMARLLSAHPPQSESPAARADAIAEIQRATESSALAHDCVVVVDVSGKSLNGVSVVFFAVETLDLTEEVVQRLNHR